MSHSGHFDLDIPRALHAQLIRTFEALQHKKLSRLPKLTVPKEIGVYGLFLDDRLVYVGKATSLNKRLGEHAFKIRGRRNISDEKIGFVCLTVNPNWAAYAPENILTQHFNGEDLCEWNGSGFGSHDPGRGREETDKPPDGFDGQFPIRTEWPCDWLDAGTYSALDLLLSLKKNLPYLLRYQTSAGRTWVKGHKDFDDCDVDVPTAGMHARKVLQLITSVLPGWQSTAFPSHIIFYKEARAYKHGEVL